MITDEQTLSHRLRELVQQGLSPDEAARAALKATRKDLLIEKVLPNVRWQASSFARAITRSHENEAFAPLAESEYETPACLDDDEEQEDVTVPASTIAWRLLAGDLFVLPNGTRVHWLDATADDHRKRAAWLRQQASTTVQTAERHETAAAEIEAADVTCLRDLCAADPESGAA